MVKKYSLKNGEVRYMYHTYLSIDPVTNKKVHKKKQGFKTKKEAELAEARLKYEIIKNGFSSEKIQGRLMRFMIYGWNLNICTMFKNRHCKKHKETL